MTDIKQIAEEWIVFGVVLTDPRCQPYGPQPLRVFVQA